MVRDEVRALIEAAIVAAWDEGVLPDFELPPVDILRPKQAGHGDYSTNVAMLTAAAIRKRGGEKVNPRQIAQAIADHVPADQLIGKVEIAGPGFINIYLAEAWLQQQVSTIIKQGSEFGNLDLGAGQHWQVEYVSANPTGPIHYGGARNAALGDVLANVLEAAGYQVQREYYVNDGGAQFDHFAATLYARYAQLLGQDEPLPEDGYQGEYMLDYAQIVVDSHGDRFLQMDRAEAVAELKEIGRELVIPVLKEELASMGVVFDNWFSEQGLYDKGLVQQSLDYLDERGELERREGALWFQASRYPKNDQDTVVVRSNGAPTYFAGDIAYHYDKFFRRKYDKVVNVWSVDHQGHVNRMDAMMRAFGLDPEQLVILMYDLVRLIRDGKEVKLSKRAGNLITIGDVVSEVGADALRFNLLTRAPESNIDFDLDLAVAQKNENPVFYVQYGPARINSILNKAREAGVEIPEQVNAETSAALATLTHPSELALIRKLLDIEEQIELAVQRLSPHNLTHYALELAKTFSAFYRDCHVINAETPELRQARLQLCAATRIVLTKTLSLLGISAPEVMWMPEAEVE